MARSRRAGIVSAAAVVVATWACSGTAPASAGSGEWESTTETEGDVTTVVTTSGSKWGGTARLVEEFSLGVDVGEEPYMFGSISAIWPTDDEVYVADAQVPTVRVFDRDGTFLREIGGPGQGPGEYERPAGLAVGPDGRVYVADATDRVNVFAPDGTSLETWQLPSSVGAGGGLRFRGTGLTMTGEGRIFARVIQYPEVLVASGPIELKSGMHEVGADGPVGEPLWAPEVEYERPRVGPSDRQTSLPFAPGVVSTFTPSGAWVVGISDDYSFEIHHPDGRLTRVRRYWNPVPVHPDEAEYAKRMRIASMQRRSPDWSWSGPEIPEIKPAFYTITPDHSGRILVSREGPGRRVEDCSPGFDTQVPGFRACWEVGSRTRDFFDLEGDYLGELEFPQTGDRVFAPHIRDDEFWAWVEDPAGIIKVKRYRIVLPADAS